MAVTVFLELNLQADKVTTLLETMKAILPDTRAYDGCISVEVVQNADTPTDIVLIEKWESRGHHEKYAAWRAETGSSEKLGALLAAPPTRRYFETQAV